MKKAGGNKGKKQKRFGGKKVNNVHTLLTTCIMYMTYIMMYMYMISESKPFYLMQFDAVHFGARFAVFVRRVHVLPSPCHCHATRNLWFWRFHRRRDTVVSTCCFTGNGTG